MTREEVTARLEMMFQECSFPQKRCKGDCCTCSKAIDALQAEPKVVGDIVSRGDTRRVVTVTEPSDLISRANAIRWVKTECNPYGKPTLDYDSGLKFIEHLKKMPSRLPSAETEWIPCSERLPERDELVLVTYKTTDKIHLCKYIDDGSENPWWSYIDDCCACNNVVIAWMPLPTPYKGGDTE